MYNACFTKFYLYSVHYYFCCLSHPETSVHEIEECFRSFVDRSDIAIILINQNIAEHIRHLLDSHTEPVPAVLEIPSKDSPYDPSKDSILRRAKVWPELGIYANLLNSIKKFRI